MAPRYYHFSVDDVLASFAELASSAHAQPRSWLLDYCQELNADFNAHVDLYLFFQQPGFSLADLPDELSSFFAQHPWLRLGPHALDVDTPPHVQSEAEQTKFLDNAYRQITRFAGLDRISTWVRLHYFSECFEQACLLNQYGTTGLFTTDKPAISYRLPAKQIEELRQHGRTVYQQCELIRSHVRIENLVGRSLGDRQLDAELMRLFDGAECAIIFTHEYELMRPEIREMTRRVFEWIGHRQLQPIFPSMDHKGRASSLCCDGAS